MVEFSHQYYFVFDLVMVGYFYVLTKCSIRLSTRLQISQSLKKLLFIVLWALADFFPMFLSLYFFQTMKELPSWAIIILVFWAILFVPMIYIFPQKPSSKKLVDHFFSFTFEEVNELDKKKVFLKNWLLTVTPYLLFTEALYKESVTPILRGDMCIWINESYTMFFIV